MKRAMIGLMMAGGLLLAAACGNKEESKPTATETAAPAMTAESIGVPECDAYFKKVVDCMGKKPELKPMLEPAMKQSAQAWKPLAANPATKDGLVKGCQAATEQLAKQCN
jgi:hypothetical protein